MYFSRYRSREGTKKTTLREESAAVRSPNPVFSGSNKGHGFVQRIIR